MSSPEPDLLNITASRKATGAGMCQTPTSLVDLTCLYTILAAEQQHIIVSLPEPDNDDHRMSAGAEMTNTGMKASLKGVYQLCMVYYLY
jgi:hypothetical protein